MKRLAEHLRRRGEKLTVLADQAIVSGVNFLMGILIARHLGLEGYGFFVTAWMMVMVASSIHQAFIIQAMFTLYPKQKNGPSYVAHLMGIQVLFSIATFFIVFIGTLIISRFYEEWAQPHLAVMLALVAALYVFNDFLRRLFFMLHRPFSVLTMDLFGYLLQPVLLVWCVYTATVEWEMALAFILIAQGVSILVALVFQYRSGIAFHAIRTHILMHWSYSRYLIGTAALQWTSGNSFLVAAAGIVGPVAVGAVRMAQNLVGVLHLLFLAMENIVPVKAAELMISHGKKDMLLYVRRIGTQALLPAISLLMLIMLFSKPLISSLYGGEYVAYQDILLAFGGIYLLVFLGTMLRFIIRTMEKNGIIFFSYVATTIFSLLMAGPLVHSFDIYGVILGLFLTQVLSNVIFIIFLRTELKWILK